MKKYIKKDVVASKTNLEFEVKATKGHAAFAKANMASVHTKEEIIINDLRFQEPLSHALRKAKSLLYQKSNFESPFEEIELHWMAFAVYNQK